MKKVNCLICKGEFFSNRLAIHIEKIHKISRQRYYNEYVNVKHVNKCKCGNELKFINLVRGYKKYCVTCSRRIKSPLCKEYWIERGLTVNESQEEISKLQMKNSMKNNEKYSIEFYISKGCNIEEARQEVELYTKTHRPNYIEFWLEKYHIDEASVYHLDYVKKHNNWVSECGKKTIKQNRPSLEKYKEKYGIEQGIEKYKDFNHKKGRSMRIDYWLSMGLNLEEARGKIERPNTYDLKWIQKKYKCSISKAMEIKQKRINKWVKKCEDPIIAEKMRIGRIKGFMKSSRSWSDKSQELFWDLCDRIEGLKCNSYFATNNYTMYDNSNNYEYVVYTEDSFRRLDFFIPETNHCIEFNGTYWHGRLPKEHYIKRDQDIKNIIKDIKILEIGETDFDENRKSVIEKCIKFIRG